MVGCESPSRLDAVRELRSMGSCLGLERLGDLGLERAVLWDLVSADLAACDDAGFFAAATHRRQAAALMAVCKRWRALLGPLSRSWKARARPPPPKKRALVATTPAQRNSLAEKCDLVRLARYETVSLGRREAYFDVSCRPITVKAEDDMELLSDLSTWGERFLDFWDRGVYACARCERPLYASDDKWSGPCLWPSWRRDLPGAARHAPVQGYNGYVVDVHELYCGGCDLFLGHAFADARDKGDAHPDARWRH